MNPIKTFKKLKLLYKFISLKNRLNLYIASNFSTFGAYRREDYLNFKEYAYYKTFIATGKREGFTLYIYCNNQYIIFKRDNLPSKDLNSYIIIKKQNSIKIDGKINSTLCSDINFLSWNSCEYYKLYDYYNENYDLYKTVEYILNKKHDYIARSICFILGGIITYFIPILYNYIISIIISK